MSKTGKTKIWALVTIIIIVIVAGAGAYYYTMPKPPPPVEKPVQLKFASNDIGTSWYLLGGAAAGILKESLPVGSTVDVLPYAGGVANNILVYNRSADLATSFTLTTRLAYGGIAPMYKDKMENLRLLAAPVDPYWFGVAVPKDSDIQILDDIISPKRTIKVGTGPKVQLSEYQITLVLEAYDLSRASWEAKLGTSITYAGITTLMKEFQAKRMDVIFWVVNPGHPSWSELFINPGMRFISLPDKVVNYLVSKYNLKADKLKAGLFSGSNEATTVGIYTVLVMRSDIPNNVAYALAKALVEKKDKLVTAYKAAEIWDPSKYKEYAVIPYHPGVEQYYKERFG